MAALEATCAELAGWAEGATAAEAVLRRARNGQPVPWPPARRHLRLIGGQR